jgi:polysaccharide export outer membrane protein
MSFRDFLKNLVLVLACTTSSFAQSQPQPARPAQAGQPQPVATAPAPRSAEYILGPGDVIRITVYQSPDLSLETRISENGQITFPLIGTVAVGGQSVAATEQRIGQMLRDGGFVNKPQVNILLVTARSSQISILGQVARPGRYPIEVVNSRVSEMIAAAGGVLPTGADTVSVTGLRDGKQVKFEVDLPTVLSGRTSFDVPVASGDILYIDRAPTFYIYGEVQRPGNYRLERGMTVLQALAQGGGLTPRGTERGLRINRRDEKGALYEVKPKMDDPVLRDDVLYIRESIF